MAGTFGWTQDTDKLLQLNKGQVVTAYSAFQRLAQKSGSPGAPVVDPPSQLPPIPSNAADALRSVGLKEDPIPTLKDLGYNDEPTSVFKVKKEKKKQSLSAVPLSPIAL